MSVRHRACGGDVVKKTPTLVARSDVVEVVADGHRSEDRTDYTSSEAR